MSDMENVSTIESKRTSFFVWCGFLLRGQIEHMAGLAGMVGGISVLCSSGTHCTLLPTIYCTRSCVHSQILLVRIEQLNFYFSIKLNLITIDRRVVHCAYRTYYLKALYYCRVTGYVSVIPYRRIVLHSSPDRDREWDGSRHLLGTRSTVQRAVLAVGNAGILYRRSSTPPLVIPNPQSVTMVSPLPTEMQ